MSDNVNNTPADSANARNSTSASSAKQIATARYAPPSAQADVSKRSSIGLPQLALLGVALLLTMFVLFLFFARSIQITVDAVELSSLASLSSVGKSNQGQVVKRELDATVQLATWLKLPIGNRFLVLPGKLNATVSAPGFQPELMHLEVDQQRFQQFSATLTRLPGRLDISLVSTEPDQASDIVDAQATVFVASSAAQLDPVAVPSIIEDVPAGVIRVVVDAPLYRASSQELLVEGQNTLQTLEFELEPAWAAYQFSAAQEGVELSIDGQVNGLLPLELKLEEGSHEVMFSKSLYQPMTRTIVVTAGQNVAVPPVTLTPAKARLKVVSEPEGAAVLLGKQYKGLTPVEFELPSREEKTLSIFRPGFKAAERSLLLQPEEYQDLEFELDAEAIAVQVSVQPAGARLSVNGQDVGAGSQTLQLSSLSQTISASAPGYVTQSQTIVPTSGNRQILTFNLLTEEQHYWANIPSQYRNSAGNTMLLFKAPGLVEMGSSRREAGRRSNEPQYQVELTRAFYVSTLETTNAQYREYRSAHTSGNYKLNSLDLNNFPVAQVSWQQAALYCNWLSERESLTPFYTTKAGFVSGHNPNANGYRLLSEAEWTWLASHSSEGARTIYPWGNQADVPKQGVFGNVADQSAADFIRFTVEGYTDGYKAASPVGSFQANSKGLYDLEGNVAEWTHDWYAAQGSKPSDGAIVKDPLGPEIGEYRVVKGPSWARGFLPQLRWAYRDSRAKGRHDIGFRVARYAAP